ncbi:hypothetical protein [Colwellia ponticola]|uniref:Uncharacterized protein n=1 Tax=Colwellia ponticola TaxID=2304625 RepID=A0A8H2JL13_9GAMM|nr:hypothetical protein [Colwellia ponticola]TMM44952.1 hypothetical protein FCS21_10730 [Colwellia ponticola]
MPSTTPNNTMPNNMSTEVRNSLEAINKVSRQLLSQLDSQIDYTNVYSDNRLDNDDTSKTIMEQRPVTDEQLRGIVSKRMFLIEQLFTLYTQEQLSSQLPLINEMVSLDEQLIVKSQQHKQLLASRMLKIKQSKKVTKLYKGY